MPICIKTLANEAFVFLCLHRRPKLTFRESEKLIIYLFIYGSRLCEPFILRGVRLHENRWEFEHFIRRLWGIKYRSFRTLNTLKYPHFLRKMIKTNSPLVCPLCFCVIFAVLGFFCHHCSTFALVMTVRK